MEINDSIPKEELKKLLTAEQYTCTQEEGTEAPFRNAYWNHHELMNLKKYFLSH